MMTKTVSVAGQAVTMYSADGRTWVSRPESIKEHAAAQAQKKASAKTQRHCYVPGCMRLAIEFIDSPDRVCDLHYQE